MTDDSHEDAHPVTPTPPMSFCSACGFKYRPDGRDFCSQCGASLSLLDARPGTLSPSDSVSTDWSQRSPYPGGFPYSADVVTMAQFIASAVASGVVGNLAYDALKQLVRRRTPALADADERLLMPELVFHAVAEQCHRYQLAVPRPGQMRVDRWEGDERTVTAFVSCVDSEMTAQVAVPRVDNGSAVEVRIRDVSQRGALERIARQSYVAKYGHPQQKPRRLRLVLLIVLIVLAAPLVLSTYLAVFSWLLDRL